MQRLKPAAQVGSNFYSGSTVPTQARPTARTIYDYGSQDTIQLEMAQAIYMDEDPPFTFRLDRAGNGTTAIRAMIAAALEAL